jgi:hypothetical protein
MKLTAAFGNFANAPKNHHPSVTFLCVSVNDKLQCGLSVSGSVHTPVFRKEGVMSLLNGAFYRTRWRGAEHLHLTTVKQIQFPKRCSFQNTRKYTWCSFWKIQDTQCSLGILQHVQSL